MATDWGKIVGPLLQNSAPTIGGLLGGLIPFPGGAMIGEELGKIVAGQFGVDPTPEAVGAAIQNTPSDVAMQKLQAAEAEAVAKWPALAQIAQANAQQSDSINATMRAELAKGQPWWAWRNLWGYSVASECAGVGVIILHGLWEGDGKAVNLFLSASNFFLTWYAMRIGVLGYIFSGSSNEKIAAATGESPGVIANVIKAIRNK